jgi:hypothetical protein
VLLPTGHGAFSQAENVMGRSRVMPELPQFFSSRSRMRRRFSRAPSIAGPSKSLSDCFGANSWTK